MDGLEGSGRVIAPSRQSQTFKVRFNLIEPSYRQNLFKSPSKMLLYHPKVELTSVSWPGFSVTEAGTRSLDKAPASKELVSSLLTLHVVTFIIAMIIKIKMRVVQRKETAYE